MSYEMYIRHLSRFGVLKNAVVSPSWMRFTHQNDKSKLAPPLVFQLDDGHLLFDEFDEFDIVIVMWRNLELGISSDAGGFVREWVGIVRDIRTATDGRDVTLRTFFCPEAQHVLEWRYILWPANESGRSKFTAVKAETMGKLIATHNFTSLATVASGRQKKDGDISAMSLPLIVQPDLARGGDVTRGVTGKHVPVALLAATSVGGGQFVVTLSDDENAWLFEYLPDGFNIDGLSTDKTSGANRVVFSRANKTMSKPTLSQRRRGRPTAAVIAGLGKEDARQTELVTSAVFAATRDIETFYQSNEETADGLIGKARTRIDRDDPIEELSFDVIQTGDVFYGPVVEGRKTYRAGDTTLARYFGERPRLIEQVTIAHRPSQGGAPTTAIAVETEDA